MKKYKHKTKSKEETQAIAENLAIELMVDKKKAFSAKVVCLWGDLGAGKTTFSQGFAKGLGIKEIVNSPTFIIMKKYSFSDRSKECNFFHFDVYRVGDPEEVLNLGWQEILQDSKNTVLLEWPEKIIEILPNDRIDVRFTILENGFRDLVLERK